MFSRAKAKGCKMVGFNPFCNADRHVTLNSGLSPLSLAWHRYHQSNEGTLLEKLAEFRE
jgi:hypothetical protein